MRTQITVTVLFHVHEPESHSLSVKTLSSFSELLLSDPHPWRHLFSVLTVPSTLYPALIPLPCVPEPCCLSCIHLYVEDASVPAYVKPNSCSPIIPLQNLLLLYSFFYSPFIRFPSSETFPEALTISSPFKYIDFSCLCCFFCLEFFLTLFLVWKIPTRTWRFISNIASSVCGP